MDLLSKVCKMYCSRTGVNDRVNIADELSQSDKGRDLVSLADICNVPPFEISSNCGTKPSK
ncbi:hypothetical protein RvY_15251 [Ramazzottius varieornatus]|uniref:Uncharacterized protein n=1 Tax=Ramazzottius varieornatus TaxID=947166 RepID=A0A1D1VU82_RAMVA|nr:hypothetical protein RvY_15251 [Ramazzottius varieornatus]